MCKRFFTLLILLCIITASYSQEALVSSQAAIDVLIKRVADLERALGAQEEQRKATEVASQQKSIQAYHEQFQSALQVIRTGIETGSEIEHIVPATLRLIATKELTETLNEINNPTSSSVGTAFSEMVIQAASEHLLPKLADQQQQQKTKSKFRKILEAIYKGPLIQTLLNSNPISSTINTAIQQAGFFEMNRQGNVTITRDQLRQVDREHPLTVQVGIGNMEGPAFTDVELNAFNSALQDRVAFYSALNGFTKEQSKKTEELLVEASIIKKAVRAGKSQICRLLNIDSSDASNSLYQRYDNLTNEQERAVLREPNFKKALSLSDYAKEQLPDVKNFQNTVINALLSYIDGYIKILDKFKVIPGAGLDADAIGKQIQRLQNIKSTLSTPLRSV